MNRFRNMNSMTKNFRSTDDNIYSFLFNDLRDELKKVGSGIRELETKMARNCDLQTSLVQQVQEDIRRVRHDNLKTHMGIFILIVGWSILAVDNLIGWKEVFFAVLRKVKDEMPIKRKIRRD